jgi:hypothetical protein
MTNLAAIAGSLRRGSVNRLLPRGRPALTRQAAPAPLRTIRRRLILSRSLIAEPLIELQDGSVNQEYRAREVFGDEKALRWRRAVNAYPDYADYQRKRGTRS